MKLSQSTLLIVSSLVAYSINLAHASEQSYLYKDQRIMAMGGANVAAGGYSTSVFSNPAGIAKVSNEHGMVVELLGIQAGISSNSEDLLNDINDAIDSEDIDTINAALQKHNGKSTHIDVSNYSSITNNHGQFAWTLGLLAAVDTNITPVNETLEIQARGYGGITAAATYTIQPSDMGDLSLGLGVKVISQQSYEGILDVNDLINSDDLGDKIEDDLQDDGSALGVDLGAIYQFNTQLKPSIGISVLNIGELDFDGHYGSQPMTVNIGASIQPDLSFVKNTVIAIDYVDLLKENKTRNYSTTSTGDLTYSDSDESDSLDRVRIGASALVYENSWSALELSTGLYQSAYTAGFTITASIVRIGFTTYQEKLSSDYSDRRYNLSTAIVW